MAGYDPKKAETFNKLRQQGVSEDAALAQAGISGDQIENYAIGTNGQLGALVVGFPTTGRPTPGLPASVDYEETSRSYTTTKTTTSYTSTSTVEVSGGGSTTITDGPALPTTASRALQPALDAKQAEIDAFIKDNPSNFARKKMGLPPLTPQEVEARNNQLNTLQDQQGQIYNQQVSLLQATPGSTTTEPNTTTTTRTTTTQLSSSREPVNFNQDEQLSQSTEQQLEKTTTRANANSATDTPLNPSSDPSQFPAYDDEGNLQLGFAVNEETGQTYYKGVGPATQQTEVNAGQDPGENVFDPGAAGPPPGDWYDTPAPTNDPLAGLTPKQVQALGGADPTDPYIRARLGIPQLPGSILNITAGFGSIKTGVKALDSALGIIGGLSSLLGGGAGGGQGLSSLFNNFASTVGGLFGKKPTASAAAATTGSGVAGMAAPAATPATKDTPVNPASDPSQFPAYDDEGNLMPGFKINEETGQTYYAGDEPPTKDSAVNPASDPSQFPAYDDEGNLMPGFKINEETGQTYYAGVEPPTKTSSTTLDAEQADAFYNGTGTPTVAEQNAANAETAADAAAIYPGTNNTNLKEINVASASIEANNAGIANAEKIIAANNAELLDPNISDARRAELEANNAEQYQYIDIANENTAYNENVIVANADAFAAGGGDPESGQGPDQVSAFEDPATQFYDQGELPPADFYDAGPVDTTQDVGENVFDPGETFNADGESVFDPENVDPNSDPFEQARYEAQLQSEAEAEDVVLTPEELDAAEDPFEAARLEAEQELNRQELAEQATDLEPGVDPGEHVFDPTAAGEEPVDWYDAGEVDPNEGGLELPPGAEEDDPPTEEPYALNPDDDEAIAQQQGTSPDPNFGANPDNEDAAAEAAVRNQAQAQATYKARYGDVQRTPDWRVRLSLAPGAQYLYNDPSADVLKPLSSTSGTNGVIFPYVPNISTTYSANYEQYDLTHSNYRGIFYKNSRVGDISVRGTFTAQDTQEANYLLAVIHFFRSVTKMFYGQDAQRGAPPPICYLNGFGQYQFSNHPVVVSAFNYTLPNDVDYIRTTSPNNFGLNLLDRYNQTPAPSTAGSGPLAGLNRLKNAVSAIGGLPKGAENLQRGPYNAVPGMVSNQTPATYVPTKMEIDITLIPVQSRSQVSQQFSLRGFANGDLLKGGFW